MKYSTAKALINADWTRQAIRTVDAYLLSDSAEWLQDALVLDDATGREIEDYFYDLFYECHEVADSVKMYVDTEAFQRDCLLGGDYSILEHEGYQMLICNH